MDGGKDNHSTDTDNGGGRQPQTPCPDRSGIQGSESLRHGAKAGVALAHPFLGGPSDHTVQTHPLAPLRGGQTLFPSGRPPESRPSHFVRVVARKQRVKSGRRAIHVRVAATIPRRSGIARRAAPGNKLRVRAQQTDVRKTGDSAEKQDILRFHIAVNQSGIGKRLQSQQYWADDRNDLFAAEPISLG